jgi:hypothetical protein
MVFKITPLQLSMKYPKLGVLGHSLPKGMKSKVRMKIVDTKGNIYKLEGLTLLSGECVN